MTMAHLSMCLTCGITLVVVTIRTGHAGQPDAHAHRRNWLRHVSTNQGEAQAAPPSLQPWSATWMRGPLHMLIGLASGAGSCSQAL